MSHYPILFILLALSIAPQVLGRVYVCQDGQTKPYERLVEDEGELHIDTSLKQCGFSTDTRFLALRLTDSPLNANESIQIYSDSSSEPHTYNPPLWNGYIVYEYRSSKLVFNFDRPDTSNLDSRFIRLKFIKKEKFIRVDGDSGGQFKIDITGRNALDIKFEKTIEDMVHLQVIGADIIDSPLGHVLIEENTRTLKLQNIGLRGQVRIVTTPVLASCSGSANDSVEASHKIQGPLAAIMRTGYRCVNLYHSNLEGPQAHFEVDFKDFRESAGRGDQLYIRGDRQALSMVEFTPDQYVGDKFSFWGKDLAVVYDGPIVSDPCSTLFRLEVKSVANGGLIDQTGPMEPPKRGNRWCVGPPFGVEEIPR